MSNPGAIDAVQMLAGRLGGLPELITEQGLHIHIASRLTSASARVDASTLSERQGNVAIFHVHGVLSPEPSWFDEISSKALAAELRLAKDDEDVAAGLLSIKSPGGYSMGMLDLAAAAKEFAAKKPLHAQVTQCCCSGAFWLASQATAIFAEIDAEIGSIGVRSLLYDYSKYFAELGIEAIDTNTGPYKSLGVLGAPVTEEQRAYLQERVDAIMVDFAKAVKSGRKLSADEFSAVATGRTWEGKEAIRLKLIDGIQSPKKTLAGLVAGSKPKNRSKAMSTNADDTAPKAATHKELKAAMPSATADFILDQLEKNATVSDALQAYNEKLAAAIKAKDEEVAAAEARAKAAEEKAAKPAPTPEPTKIRGAKFGEATGKTDGAGEADPAGVDYRQMAHDYQEKHKCRWSEATLAIKKRYPEAREAFGAPTLAK